MGWVCTYCSTNNEDADLKCLVCDQPKPASTVCTLTAKRVQTLGLRGDVLVPMEFNVIGEGAFLNRPDITAVTLHPGVGRIMKNAFSGCQNLQRVTVNGTLEYIGPQAFYNCRKLTSAARPRAMRVAADAFAMAPAPPPPPRPVPSPGTPRPAGTAATRSASRSHPALKALAWTVGILVALAIIISLFALIGSQFDPPGWHWLVGIGGGVVLLFLVLILTAFLSNWFELSAVGSILLLISSLANLLLLMHFQGDYAAIACVLNFFMLLGLVFAAWIAFDDLEPGWGSFDILLALGHVAMFIATLVIL